MDPIQPSESPHINPATKGCATFLTHPIDPAKLLAFMFCENCRFWPGDTRLSTPSLTYQIFPRCYSFNMCVYISKRIPLFYCLYGYYLSCIFIYMWSLVSLRTLYFCLNIVVMPINYLIFLYVNDKFDLYDLRLSWDLSFWAIMRILVHFYITYTTTT